MSPSFILTLTIVGFLLIAFIAYVAIRGRNWDGFCSKEHQMYRDGLMTNEYYKMRRKELDNNAEEHRKARAGTQSTVVLPA